MSATPCGARWAALATPSWTLPWMVQSAEITSGASVEIAYPQSSILRIQLEIGEPGAPGHPAAGPQFRNTERGEAMQQSHAQVWWLVLPRGEEEIQDLQHQGLRLRRAYLPSDAVQ